jgi:hypothetical protein
VHGCGGPLGATATAHDTRKTVTALARASAADALERFERKEDASGIKRASAFLAALPG